jgi:hypothetical protein
MEISWNTIVVVLLSCERMERMAVGSSDVMFVESELALPGSDDESQLFFSFNTSFFTTGMFG